MISCKERTSLLLQSSTQWTDKTKKDEAKVELSLSQRLSILSTSADRWKSRVEKEPDLAKCNPGSRSINRSGKRCTKVTPLHIDQGLTSFFTPKDVTIVDSIVEIESVDLDVVPPTEKLNMIRKTPISRPQKRLISRTRGVKKETEPNFVKPSMEGMKEDIIFGVSEDLSEPVAKSAREGLSSVENYNETRNSLRSFSNNHHSYVEVLIQVGGDDFIDARAVIVSNESIHNSASYLLITQSSLIIHNGSESKALERAKTMAIASSILHSKQLNSEATKVERTCESEHIKRQFWRTLNSKSEKGTVITGSDLIKKNKIFSVDEHLEIRMDMMGQVPCHSILHPSKCLIFDFYSELYIWSGRNCSRKQSLAAEDYARQISMQQQSNLSSFLVVRKISQGIPDVLFSSKFVNWPTDYLLTSTPQTKKTTITPIYKWKQPIQSDASSIACHLLKSREKLDEIVIEDIALDGTNENVITERKDLWRLDGDELVIIDETNELWRDKCYCVRWQYRIETRVGRLNCRDIDDELQTELTERPNGRSRIAWFYWLGRKSGIKEQGKCALRLSEMDSQKNTHIRIEEGEECSIFLSLFSGTLKVLDSEMSVDTAVLLVLSKSHGRSSYTQMELSSPLRSHGTYIRKREDTWIVVAGMDSDIKDVRAAFNVWNSSSKEMEYLVQGDDASEWIECKDSSTNPRMYRILGSESDIVQPSRPGTTFPYSQNSLNSYILVDCGSMGWLWSEYPLSDTVLNVAVKMSNERGYQVDVIEKGREPNGFKAIFPFWIDYDNTREGKSLKLEKIIEERMSLTPAQVIQRRNELNEQIDLDTIEKNLSDESFSNMYGISRTNFSSLPQWKQLIIRKERGYF